MISTHTGSPVNRWTHFEVHNVHVLNSGTCFIWSSAAHSTYCSLWSSDHHRQAPLYSMYLYNCHPSLPIPSSSHLLLALLRTLEQKAVMHWAVLSGRSAFKSRSCWRGVSLGGEWRVRVVWCMEMAMNTKMDRELRAQHGLPQ